MTKPDYIKYIYVRNREQYMYKKMQPDERFGKPSFTGPMLSFFPCLYFSEEQ